MMLSVGSAKHCVKERWKVCLQKDVRLLNDCEELKLRAVQCVESDG